MENSTPAKSKNCSKWRSGRQGLSDGALAFLALYHSRTLYSSIQERLPKTEKLIVKTLFLIIFFSVIFDSSSAQAMIFELCSNLFETQITKTETFARQLKWKPLKYDEIRNLTKRTNLDLRLDETVAQELSRQGILKELNIQLPSNLKLTLKNDLMDEIDNQIYLKIKNVKNLEEFRNMLLVLRKNKQLKFSSTSLLKRSPFVRRGLLDASMVERFINGSMPDDFIIDSIIRNASKSLVETTSIKELTDFIRISKKTGIHNLLPPGYLDNNPLMKSGLLDAKKIEAASEADVKQVIFEELLDYSLNANTFGEFFDLVEVIKYSDLSGEQLDALLNPIIKLGSEFSYAPQLLKAVKNSVKSGKLDVNLYIGDRLSRSVELMYVPVSTSGYWRIVEKIESGLNFSLSLSRLAKESFRGNEVYEYLARSPFCKKHGIGNLTIMDMVKKLKEKKFITVSDAVEEILKHYPQLGLTKKLLSLDNYDNSVKIVSVKDQCSFGSCWIHSPLEKYEIELSAKLKRPVELSPDYLYYHYIKGVFPISARDFPF